MTSVTLSSKYRIVIPKEARKQMQLKSGMKLDMVVYCGQIALIPVHSIKKLRGSLRGIDTTIIRDPDRV